MMKIKITMIVKIIIIVMMTSAFIIRFETNFPFAWRGGWRLMNVNFTLLINMQEHTFTSVCAYGGDSQDRANDLLTHRIVHPAQSGTRTIVVLPRLQFISIFYTQNCIHYHEIKIAYIILIGGATIFLIGRCFSRKKIII